VRLFGTVATVVSLVGCVGATVVITGSAEDDGPAGVDVETPTIGSVRSVSVESDGEMTVSFCRDTLAATAPNSATVAAPDTTQAAVRRRRALRTRPCNVA
jgi:hypothetical protein